MKLKKGTLDSISFAVEQERLKQEEIAKNKNTISNFAFMSNISDTPYLRMLDEGREISYILEIMNEDIVKEKSRQEVEQKRRDEAEEKAKAERQELVNVQLEKDFGCADQSDDNPSYINALEHDEYQSKDEEPAVRAVKYRATIEIEFDSIKEKDNWKEIMESNGFGNFKALKFEKI